MIGVLWFIWLWCDFCDYDLFGDDLGFCDFRFLWCFIWIFWDFDSHNGLYNFIYIIVTWVIVTWVIVFWMISLIGISVIVIMRLCWFVSLCIWCFDFSYYTLYDCDYDLHIVWLWFLCLWFVWLAFRIIISVIVDLCSCDLCNYAYLIGLESGSGSGPSKTFPLGSSKQGMVISVKVRVRLCSG
jgi:hypothetical protein